MITGTNYCGPGGSGKVLGEVDAACAKHDNAYKAPFYTDYIKSQDADKVFLFDMRRAKPGNFRQSVTRQIALKYFTLKTSLWDMVSSEPMENKYPDEMVMVPYNVKRVDKRRHYAAPPALPHNKVFVRSSTHGVYKKRRILPRRFPTRRFFRKRSFSFKKRFYPVRRRYLRYKRNR